MALNDQIEINHAHISYLKKLREEVANFQTISATKKKLVMDMMEHGLVRVENELIYVEAKARDMIIHIETKIKDWLKSEL